jgi:hypothetical protein
MSRARGKSAAGASPVIETALELYRELQRRGLHLRSGHGRDDALLEELRPRLGWRGKSLTAHLKATSLPAAPFLAAFLDVAAPFARMFQEIWEYLAAAGAPEAEEKIRVRFGFDPEDRSEVSLEQFREYVERTRTLLVLVRGRWTPEALRELFPVARVLRPFLDQNGLWTNQGYRPGEPLALPPPPTATGEFARLVGRVRSVFEWIVEEGARTRGPGDAAPPEYRAWRNTWASPLTDHAPVWLTVMRHGERIPAELGARAVELFAQKVEPLLETQDKVPIEQRFREPLDVLALPFWKHRWHTYEVWATVAALRALDDFRPCPRIAAGHMPIDGYDQVVVADLGARGHDEACLIAQLETPFHRKSRQAIKPDLNVCFEQRMVDASRAVVVEMKQRERMTPAYLREVATSYRDGSPQAARVLVLSYDQAPALESLERIDIISHVHPGAPEQVLRFELALRAAVGEAGLAPGAHRSLVLLDVSSSVGNAYATASAKQVLARLSRAPGVHVRRFSDHVLEAPSAEEIEAGLATRGGTQLGEALLATKDLPADAVYVVSDGGFERSEQELQAIRPYRLVALTALDTEPWGDSGGGSCPSP